MIATIGLDRQADHVGMDRNLTMAAIDERRQTDARRPAQVADRVERGADRPSGEKHVVHQHDFRTIQVEGDLGASEHRPALALAQVVAVKRDVDRPHLDLLVEQNSHLAGQPLRERHAPASGSRPGTTACPRRPDSASLRAIDEIRPLICCASQSRCSARFHPRASTSP